MKKLILIVLLKICISYQVFAEEYLCGADISKFSDEGNLEIKSYTRLGNIFMRETQYGKSIFTISDETNAVLILTQSEPPETIFITIIDKKNKTFLEHFINISREKSIGLSGECLVRN